MSFTEFACRPNTGSNLNAGTRTGNSTEPSGTADFTYAGGNFVNSTGVFTVASGNPGSDGVAVGDFASIYNPLNALECYGVTDSYASCPDSAALSITGDLDARAYVSLEDWTPSTGNGNMLVGKWVSSGNQRSWFFNVGTTGALQFAWSANGTATVATITSTATLSTFLPNQTKWLRVTLDVDNGASGNDVKFYTSDDGSSWTQLGSTVTTAGTTSIFDSTAVVEVGSRDAGAGGSALLTGKVFKAEIYNGIAGTRVANPDFTAQSAGTTSFSDGDGNTWTVGSAAAIVATTATNFVGRVTARDSTTITVSTTAKAGPVPPDGTGVYTLKIGGAWKGPNGAEMFPFDFVQNTLTNSAGDYPRINFKNSATYSITAAMTHNNDGPAAFQGYTTSYADGGRATIDGGTSGASYNLLSGTGANLVVEDLILQNNGATGNSSAFSLSGAECVFRRCVANSVRGYGFVNGGTSATYIECEAYGCNQSNTSTIAGFRAVTVTAYFIRCISHDNSGSNAIGFVAGGPCILVGCIADTNGNVGFECSSISGNVLLNCDAYNNGSDGIRLSNSSGNSAYIENCNLVKNGGYGINGSGAGARNGAIVNCGFGSGTQANTSGTTTGLSAIVESGTITYAADVTPWVDPANGDFRINLDASTGTGRGAFTQTAASYTGTVGYPDVGASQRTVSELTTTTGQSVIDGILNGMQIKKNTNLSNFTFFLRNSAGTAVTGATVTATRSIDGAAFAACANAVSEIANGWYKINLAAADLNGTVIALNFAASGALTVTQTILTQSA